ncbi:RNA polymerase sigma factor [Nocardioides sp.]|uniref:RNA polymerase sigma factor n=1 Tax=Nocardioides sp. TaxID=35761 RepID=UPI0035AF5FFC
MDGHERSDAELLAAVSEGDEAALRALFDRHSPWLLARLRRRSSDPDLAAEALQDTFLAVWRHPGGFRGDGEVGAWLWGIAIRQLVTRLRKRAAPLPVAEQLLSALSPTVRSAEDELLLAAEHGDLGSALGRLSPELRDVLRATALDGLSTREAARLLGLPQGTVKTRLRAARRQLREQLVVREGW